MLNGTCNRIECDQLFIGQLKSYTGKNNRDPAKRADPDPH